MVQIINLFLQRQDQASPNPFSSPPVLTTLRICLSELGLHYLAAQVQFLFFHSKINLFCFTDLEYHCHPVHHTTEFSVCSLLPDFSSGFDPIAAGTVIQFLTEKHSLHITKGKLNSAYDKNIAKFSTIHPKTLLCVCVCHK